MKHGSTHALPYRSVNSTAEEKWLRDSPWFILHRASHKQVFVRKSLVHRTSHILQTRVCKILIDASYIPHSTNTCVWYSHLCILHLTYYKQAFVGLYWAHLPTHIVQASAWETHLFASYISHRTRECVWDSTCRILHLTSYKQMCVRFALPRITSYIQMCVRFPLAHLASHILHARVCEILIGASYISPHRTHTWL